MKSNGEVIRMTQEELESKYPGYDAGCRIGNAKVVVRFKKDMTQEEYDAKKEEIKQIYVSAIRKGAYKFSEQEKQEAEKRAKERKKVATS